MEENEDKKPEVNEPEAPEAEPEKPVENGSEAPKKEGGKLDALKDKAKVLKDKAKDKAKVVKQKTGEFMGVKRNRIIVLACSGAAIVALVVGLSVGLTQCHGNGGDNTSSSNSESKGGEGGSSSAHTHEYGTAWKSDATQHWHECSCGDKKDAANHAFSTERVVTKEATPTEKGKKGYQCTVCEYAKDEIEYTPYLAEGDFSSALKFDGDEFTIHIALDAEAGSSQSLVKDGLSICLTRNLGSNTIVEYYTKEADGTASKYYIYNKEASGTWVKSEDGDKMYDYYSTYDANVSAFDSKLTYAGLTFDKEKGCYAASYTNAYNTEISAELYFDNGKLIKAVKSYGGKSYVYTFSDSAEAIELPSDAHMHTFAPGTLDLNSSSATFEVTCTSCGETQTKERLESDSVGTVLYGYYPQTHVKDTATIASLDALTSAESNGWYKLGDDYYAKATANLYGSIGSFDDGDQIVTTVSYWFKVEPISWRVLANSDGSCSLVSNVLLDAHRYNADFSGKNASGYYANNYAQSELRSWLNGDFLSKAFSLGNSHLKTVTVDNSASTIYASDATYASSNTEDKVYLLSYADYANTSYFPSLDSKKCKLSDWARANYAYDPSIAYTNPSHYGQYWTRSPSPDSSRKASYVDQDGHHTYDAYVDQAYTCVRPAITVKLPVTRDHQHKNPTSGSLDLNNGGTKLIGNCPVCDAKITCDYDSSKHTITGFLYGYYPQSHVSDSSTIASLDGLTTAESNGWYKLGDDYYAKAASSPASSGTKFDDGDSLDFDSTYWFKVDPIEWDILSKDSATYSLVSNRLLDTHKYSAEYSGTGTVGYYANNYEHSSLRAWLTGDFYKLAFSKDDTKLVQKAVDNSASTTNRSDSTYGSSSATNDKIYLLSYQEYASASNFASSAARICQTSDWTRCRGCSSTVWNGIPNCGDYWTRSPYYNPEDWFDSNYASMVRHDGALHYNGIGGTGSDRVAIRPAITITLS